MRFLVSSIQHPVSSIEHLFFLHPAILQPKPCITPPPVIDTGNISGHNLTSFKRATETTLPPEDDGITHPTTKGGCS
jgi:hypothetical protein